MHFLSSSEIYFPSPSEASEEGLLAIGGDLSEARILLAYQSGIFPWYEATQPILWWSPDPRMVLFPKQFRVSKSLQKKVDKNYFKVTYNTQFEQVIRKCASVPRKGQDDTWITEAMIKAYIKLHRKGHAYSVEVWRSSKLVGGLYGIDLPKQGVFCGESMFSEESDASKVGFYHLVAQLQEKNYSLIDCQVYSEHLERLGAKEISRDRFLVYLKC